MIKCGLVRMYQFVGNTHHIHNVYNYCLCVWATLFSVSEALLLHGQWTQTTLENRRQDISGSWRKKQQSPKLPSVVCLLSGVCDSVSMTSLVVAGSITSCAIASLFQSLATCLRNFCGPSFQTRERCSHQTCLRLTNCLSRHYCSCQQHNHEHNQLVFPN